MVLCIVVGCSKRSGRDKDVSFYRIPKVVSRKGQAVKELSQRRRSAFVSATKRADLTHKILSNDRICSRHFISGQPASLEDESNPDWLPTLNLGHNKEVDESRARAAQQRWLRATSRKSEKSDSPCSEPGSSDNVNSSACSDVESAQFTVSRATTSQTDLTANNMKQKEEDLLNCENKISCLEEEIKNLKEKIQPFTEHFFIKDDECVKFYTGLPNFKVLKAVFELVCPLHTATTKLTNFQGFIMTLIKLRLDSPYKDLAYRFGISISTVSRVFLKWLTIMDTVLQTLIIWPDRDSLWKTMPKCFRSSFGKDVAVVIDCFEVFMERPSNLLARATTWSSYKHHNTVNFLIGITPQGTVSFVSEAWGGRVSDKFLTESSGILNYLLPGDIVLADRGFNISDSVGMMQARLHLPAYTKGKCQLNALEVEDTRSIANVRIHVERVIGVVRQKYSILRGTLPVDFLTKQQGETSPHIDKIVRVCCALCNVCDSVVPFN